MWNSLANNPLIQIFIALFVLLLFSFDRNLLITQFLEEEIIMFGQ